VLSVDLHLNHTSYHPQQITAAADWQRYLLIHIFLQHQCNACANCCISPCLTQVTATSITHIPNAPRPLPTPDWNLNLDGVANIRTHDKHRHLADQNPLESDLHIPLQRGQPAYATNSRHWTYPPHGTLFSSHSGHNFKGGRDYLETTSYWN